MMRKLFLSFRKSFPWLLLLMILPLGQSYAQLNTKATPGVMLIDADAADWWGIPSDTAKIFTAGGTAPLYQDAADFSATFKTAWDSKNIYFFAEIKDDIIVKKASASYLADNLEIWLDVNNSKTATFDGVDDIKIRINRDTVLTNAQVGFNNLGDYPWTSTSKDGMRGMIIKQKEISGGYVVELSVPWDSIQMKNSSKITIGDGTTIGFNAYFCDNDSISNPIGGNRTKLVWENTTGSNPSTWGILRLSGTPAVTEISSPAIQSNMIIDGDLTDWNNLPSTSVALVNYGAANLVDSKDFSGSFKTTWDSKNFYFFADIKDDIKVKTGTFYLADNLELGLDVNNSKKSTLDKIDDVKIRINRDSIWVNTAGGNVLGDYPWTGGAVKDGMKGMVVKQKEITGGWQVELSIPWDSLQVKNSSPVVLGENSLIGLHVYLCDQDSLKDRGSDRTKLLWINSAGGAPSTWGTLKLTGTPVESDGIVYRERFINTTGANADASTVGWKSYSNLQVTEVLSTAGFQGGVSGGAGTVVSSDDNDKGYIFLYTDKLSNLLSISNTRILRNTKEISEIGFVMRDHSNGFVYTTQVAVRVAGQWYVNEEVFNVNTPAPAVTAFTTRTFVWKTTGWKKLIFNQSDATTLAVSADAAADLPAGDLENFGFFNVHPAGGGSVVVDEVYVKDGVNGGPFDAVAPAIPVLSAVADAALPAVNLSWDAVTDNEAGIVSYNVYNGLKLLVASTTALSYSVTGLDISTEYTYYVTARDLTGNESDFSNAAAAVTIGDIVAPPAPVVVATSDAAAASIVLTWLAVTDDVGTIASYDIYDAAKTLITSTADLSYTISGLAWSTAYTYYVKAVDNSGNASDFSAAAIATTVATGIAQNSLKVSVYPNPVIDRVTISAINISGIELFNALGSKVLSEKADNVNSHSVDLRSLAKGLYLLKIYDKEGKTSVSTLVKD
jgi:chitodextrinase/acetyltransferase-like isoleucine patch superfamily enzyme